jgi:AraC family ethanolamine operon transcriptional activator
MKLLVICVSRDDFAEYLASVEHLPPPDWLAKGTRLIHSPARASIAAATFLRLIGECCNNAALLAHPDMQASIRQTTMQTLAPLVVDHAISPPSSYGAFSRTQIVRRAREFILSRIDEPLQIMDICRALGVSRRVLQYSFQDVLDTNPVAYLRLLRLNGARRDLLGAGTRAQSVQDVQARWGFWHGSRFSAEYKRMYGELPSETLRRAWQPASYD